MLLVNPVDAQLPSPKADSSETQTFSYNLNGYSILYGINNNSSGYLIAIYVMDNPPLEISFTEQLPNGTETRVTKPIAYGMTIPSTSYPTDISFKLSTNEPAATKPSVPEFTVKYVDRSYDTQPTYSVDQYTGQKVVTEPSQHIDNRTIEITIQNQPFTPFTDISGNTINLLYSVRYKGSFGVEWVAMFGERAAWAGVYDPYATWGYPTQDYSSQSTTIVFKLPWNIVDGCMDIQVEALEGYTSKVANESVGGALWAVYEYPFFGEESGWSSTQTLNLANGSVTNSTPNPTVPVMPTTTPTSTLMPTNSNINGNSADSFGAPLSTYLIVIAVVVVLGVALVVLFLRRRSRVQKV
jgi:hypothetical protein